jgi:hypothetical protein
MFEVRLNMTIHAGEGSCEGVPLYRLYKAMMKQFAGKSWLIHCKTWIVMMQALLKNDCHYTT